MRQAGVVLRRKAKRNPIMILPMARVKGEVAHKRRPMEQRPVAGSRTDPASIFMGLCLCWRGPLQRRYAYGGTQNERQPHN